MTSASNEKLAHGRVYAAVLFAHDHRTVDSFKTNSKGINASLGREHEMYLTGTVRVVGKYDQYARDVMRSTFGDR